MSALWFAVAIVAGYLLGAVPFGYLVARWHGVNILKEGSCNPGATNVKRVVGRKAGNLVFGLDFGKGLVAAGWLLLPGLPVPNGIEPSWLALAALAASIMGHSFSVFLRFRGGKGVAVTLGGAIAIMPLAALIGAVVWVILFYSTRYVSVASIGLAATLPVARFFVAGRTDAVFFFALLLAVFVIYRHRENIARLARGTENRFPPRKERAGEVRS